MESSLISPHTPSWMVFILIVGGGTLLSIAGLALFHRYVPSAVRKLHNDVAGFIFASLGVIYGVLLAFVAIIIWEQGTNAAETALKEGSAAINLYRKTFVYPDQKVMEPLRKSLEEYYRLVVDKEYPSLRQSKRNLATVQAFNGIFTSMRLIHPNTEQELAIYGNMLTNLDDLSVLRAMRVRDAFEKELPSIVWFTLIAGAIITISFSYLFGTENFWAQNIMTGMLSMLIFIILFQLLMMDRPFQGPMGIKPEGFKFILEYLVPR